MVLPGYCPHTNGACRADCVYFSELIDEHGQQMEACFWFELGHLHNIDHRLQKIEALLQTRFPPEVKTVDE